MSSPEHLHICDYAAIWKDCMYVGHALQDMSNEQQPWHLLRGCLAKAFMLAAHSDRVQRGH